MLSTYFNSSKSMISKSYSSAVLNKMTTVWFTDCYVINIDKDHENNLLLFLFDI